MATKTKTYTPKELAEAIGISSKVLRAHLRKEYARNPEAKNTSWIIPEATAKKVKAHFAKNAATDDES